MTTLEIDALRDEEALYERQAAVADRLAIALMNVHPAQIEVLGNLHGVCWIQFPPNAPIGVQLSLPIHTGLPPKSALGRIGVSPQAAFMLVGWTAWPDR